MEKRPQGIENKIILSIPDSNPEELPTFVNNLLQEVMQERGMQLENSVKMQAGNDAENRLVFSPQARPKTPGLSPQKMKKILLNSYNKHLKTHTLQNLARVKRYNLHKKILKRKEKGHVDYEATSRGKVAI